MNKVLLIGNGFDLAHGLFTSYNQFLEVIKNWTSIYERLKKLKTGAFFPKNNTFAQYMCNISTMDVDNLENFDKIIKNNSWVKYFKQCEAEIDGWIDFEREIIPVINLFEILFKEKNYMLIKDGNNEFVQAFINNSCFNSNQIRIINMWDKYFKFNNGVFLKEPYASLKYGILKKKILKSLRDEFDEFIKAFEIYLLEFVHKTKDIRLLKQIKDINPDYVISFNYTHTEKLYGIDEANVHHIHGTLRENITVGINNMVLGLNEQKEQNMDFIYFVKYFQRIQKASGVKYKEFIEKRENIPYTLYIYGHSLDETDEDILKSVIGTKTKTGELNLKPQKIIIYYYDIFDYEQKVINLIKLYGREVVEEYMISKKFEFISTMKEFYSI